jgi:hypothetical protein
VVPRHFLALSQVIPEGAGPVIPEGAGPVKTNRCVVLAHFDTFVMLAEGQPWLPATT